MENTTGTTIKVMINKISGRCDGLMVSELDSGSSGPGSSPGRGHCVVARHLTLTAPLSTQVYKWVLAKFNAGGNPAMGWHPIQAGVAIFLVA